MGQGDIKQLKDLWNDFYKRYLPAQAKAKDPIQKHWPVNLDHCFARIILDNAVGKDKPWTEVLKSPAVHNMDSKQLEAAINLAERIASGEVNLVALDNRSLELRGKKRKAAPNSDPAAERKLPAVKKQRLNDAIISKFFLPNPTSPEKEGNDAEDHEDSKQQGDDPAVISAQLKRISESNLTPFRKHMLRLLCQIPRGRYSTYQSMSDHVTKTSHKTCARAVGNAMRNNPFAPEVPCHRVLANDGSLGGFCGYWGENGKFASKKHELLYEEGVRFNSKGKVKGPPFRDFKD